MANPKKRLLPSFITNRHHYYNHYLPFLILLLSSLSHYSNAISRDGFCRSCRDPSFCSKVLPGGEYPSVRPFGLFAIQKSLSRSEAFHDYVVDILRRPGPGLPTHAVRALEDCRLLAALNSDILKGCLGSVSGIDALLSASAADDFRTAMSAAATNLDTCSDGLAAHPALADEVSRAGGLADDARLHGLALALSTKGWVPRPLRRLWPWRPPRAGGGAWGALEGRELRLRFPSEEKRRVYEAAASWHRGPGRGRGRRLLQAGGGQGVNVSSIVVVSQDGAWDFKNISSAVAAAPKNLAAGNGYHMIYVTEGVYEEYVDISSNKKYLFLLGAGMNRTIITGNHSVGDNFTTFNSATLAVSGLGFLAVDLTIRNTAGPSKGQAVALRSGADFSTFYRCSFEAYQDTLYTHSNRQFYRDCDIYGTVDFIFGNAAVVLQNCNILPRLPMKGQFNAVTAQGRTDPNQSTGTTIHNCTVRAAPDLAADVNGTTKTYLGRPWKDYSRTVVMQSFLDRLIQPAGWHEWSTNVSQLSTLYYAEFANYGPGSNTSARVTWPGFHVINATEAEPFTVSPFVAGDSWIPPTGVPYVGGLIM